MSDAPFVLYSFRRCPYAMRARLALWASGVSFELREIVLKHKPDSMLAYSPKGTVPVLIVDSPRAAQIKEQMKKSMPSSMSEVAVCSELVNSELASAELSNAELINAESASSKLVIDESLDIMLWALAQPSASSLGSAWLPTDQTMTWIEENDQVFKGWLDKYKYADRFPEQSERYYRQQGELFLQKLETRLSDQDYLSGQTFGLLDAAIAPFIRQFAHVDLDWFEQSPYPKLIAWLNGFKASELFKAIMSKYPAWSEGDTPLLITPEVSLLGL